MTVLGEVATTETLRSRGVTRSGIEGALRTGTLQRVRRGVFATAAADSDQLRACVLGGRLGCVSALRRWGVWSGDGDDLHVQLAPNASRLRADRATDARGAATAIWHPSIDRRLLSGSPRLAKPGRPVTHWSDLGAGGSALDWIVAPGQALAQAMRCQDEEHAIACADSVIRHGVLPERQVQELIAHLPERLRHIGRELTPTADSGWESIFITRLRRAGFHVQSQVDVPGVGRLDGLIEECVGFEVNGLEFHSGRAEVVRDTDRVLVAQGLGVPTLSLHPHHIQTLWPSTLAIVVRTVDDARRLRGLRRR